MQPSGATNGRARELRYDSRSWPHGSAMRRLAHAAFLAALAIGSVGIADDFDPATKGTPASTATCIQGSVGYFRARVRGALVLDLNWRDAEMDCAGGPRPDGKSIRVSIGGPPRGDGKRMRFVFGIAQTREGTSGSALPTNITLILEGEQRMFATQGDHKCTIDKLTQERVGALGGPKRSYRVTARGFCTGPAATLTRGERILITSFDFAARADFEDEPSDAKKPTPTRT